MAEAERGWRKSSFSDEVQCVEIRDAPEGVLVRHSRRWNDPVLEFGTVAWIEFLHAVKSGEFETDVLRR